MEMSDKFQATVALTPEVCKKIFPVSTSVTDRPTASCSSACKEQGSKLPNMCLKH
jgi:hypothetical protein